MMRIDRNFVRRWFVWFRNHSHEGWFLLGFYESRKIAKTKADAIKSESPEITDLEVVVRAGYIIKPKEGWQQ